MTKSTPKLVDLLKRLEKLYGKPKAPWPTDPYQMILYTNCGYPASDAACAKGFAALKSEIGLRPDDILTASKATVAKISASVGSFRNCVPLASKRLRRW